MGGTRTKGGRRERVPAALLSLDKPTGVRRCLEQAVQFLELICAGMLLHSRQRLCLSAYVPRVVFCRLRLDAVAYDRHPTGLRDADLEVNA